MAGRCRVEIFRFRLQRLCDHFHVKILWFDEGFTYSNQIFATILLSGFILIAGTFDRVRLERRSYDWTLDETTVADGECDGRS
jgi:hypothetical protein